MPEGRARMVAIIALGVVGLLALLAVVDIAVTQGRVQPGVSVGDVAVGSMTPPEARAALEAAFTSGSRSPVKVVFGEKDWKVTADQIGVRVDSTASIAAAMSVGRSGTALQMVGQRIAALIAGASVPVLVSGDDEVASAVLDTLAAEVDVASLDASITVKGTEVSVAKSAPGRRVDRVHTLAAIATAFVTDSRTAQVVTAIVPVRIADADAQQAYEDALKLVSGPVTVVYADRSVSVPREQVARWVRFTTQPVVSPVVELSQSATASADASAAPDSRLMLIAGFDGARIGSSIATMTKGIGRPARDAAFVAGEGSVKITPSQVGRGPDLATLATELARACVSGGVRTATLKLVETQPKLTTEAAREMGVSDRIGTYTTTYSPSARARVSNIHLLADALDYKLVPPGGTFSFNGTAGQRTAAKGYQEAPAIVNGKLVPQLGGGVCQVGTTFFNAVFFAGLPVVERRNHSFYISHYPKGRDATVSWGGPDLKFKNDTEGWILIRTAYTSSSLTISLYGTDPGYNVKYTTSRFSGVTAHKVIEVKDPKLRKGVRIIEDAGVDGRRVTVVRTVYKGDTVVRTDTFVSNYKSKDETVRVGTKGTSVPATGTVSP